MLIHEVVDSYMETLAHGTVGRYRIPSVTPPKFKEGGNWRCFLEEFKEMVKIVDSKTFSKTCYFK